MFKCKSISTITAILFATLLVYKMAVASSYSSQPYAGTTVIARNMNQTINSITWQAVIESEAYATMNQIGWSWWHVYEMCNGLVIEYTVREPRIAVNTSFRAEVYNNQFNYCTGVKQTGNKGNHTYLKSGYTTKNIFLDNVQSFP